MPLKECFRLFCNSVLRNAPSSAHINNLKVATAEEHVHIGSRNPIYVPIRTEVNLYTDARMFRDVKRRRTIKEYAKLRLNINSLRKNKILPARLREIADAEIAALPRRGSLSMSHVRCVITSRPRGMVHRWRMSRIVWRHLADYNQLSGVMRAMW